MTDRLTHQITNELQRKLDTRPVSAGDVQEVIAAGRARRRRHTALLGAGTLAVVVIALGIVSTLRPDADRAVEPARTSGSTAPYDVPPCPDRLPELDDANYRVPNLDRVKTVRFCADLAWSLTGDTTITAEDRAWLADRDALVQDIDGFVAALRSAPSYDSDRCAALDFASTRASLAFDLDDGTRVLVAVPACTRLTVEDRAVDGQQFAEAFDNAVNRQRDSLDYTRATDRPLDCDTPSVLAPVRPQREVVVAAAWCPTEDATAIPIRDQALADLAAAWRNNQPITQQPDSTGMDTCTNLETRPADIIVRTDRADDVRLMVSPCGFLVFGSWGADESVSIPVTPESLGLS
ncbi:MAG: hypothetical protein JWN84_3603 [Nocardioides sp.]|jgi:hypothetical protein|nr:hypothetical protein [Nocardioides sp.]